MAEPSGGAERDAEGYGGSGGVGGGVGGAGGSSGPAVGGFGTTPGYGGQSALSPYAGVEAQPLGSFIDLRAVDDNTIRDMMASGLIAGWDKGGQYGYGPGIAALMDTLAGYGKSALMSGMVGQGFPSGMVSIGTNVGRGLASLGRAAGMTGTAQGFKGGTGEPGQTAPASAQEPATGQALTPQQTAFTQNVLPPTGNPLLNMAPAAQQARPGWLNPYLGTYNAPQPASPASNQGLPSGQGLGPLYA